MDLITSTMTSRGMQQAGNFCVVYFRKEDMKTSNFEFYRDTRNPSIYSNTSLYTHHYLVLILVVLTSYLVHSQSIYSNTYLHIFIPCVDSKSTYSTLFVHSQSIYLLQYVSLQEQQDRLLAERQRQAELARLRREKRQTELEGRFDSAALVLGLAERNRQNLEERYYPVEIRFSGAILRYIKRSCRSL